MNCIICKGHAGRYITHNIGATLDDIYNLASITNNIFPYILGKLEVELGHKFSLALFDKHQLDSGTVHRMQSTAVA